MKSGSERPLSVSGLRLDLARGKVVRNIVTGSIRASFAVGNSLTIAGLSGTPTDHYSHSHSHCPEQRWQEILIANARFLEQTSTQNLISPEQWGKRSR
jgi:hypothetical protein